jgi:DeoR family glycerol-3-phosphate regulon repressor
LIIFVNNLLFKVTNVIIKKKEDDIMLQQERHNQIIAKLNLEGQVRVKDLSKDFQVTEDCIRKDLTILEKANKLKRIHGGATLLRENLHTIQVNDRKNIRVEEKKQIAQKAIQLIKPGTTIFLGVSTVNIEIAKLIYQNNLNITLVTNMIDIMNIFTKQSNIKLIFLGGTLNHSSDGFIGSITIDQIKKYRFDLSFIGVVGIDIYNGNVSTYDVNDGLTKKEAIHSSKKCYIVSESAKLNLDGNYIFADMNDFTGYICEKELDEDTTHKITTYGIEII